MSTAKPIDPNPWRAAFCGLDQWALARLAIKTDRFGAYSSQGRASWSDKPLTDSILRQHFVGKQTIGLGSISPEDLCLWVAWDMDNHVSDESTNMNLNFAIVLRDRLRELGFNSVIIEDSDGKGGIHVWLLFASPIPARRAFAFSRWVVRDYKEHGLEKIECFPKSRTSRTGKGCGGGYLRTPGKHPKRNHWSRFYSVDDWLSLEDSVELLLSQTGDNPALIPEIPEEPTTKAKPQRSMAKEASSDGDEAWVRDALSTLDSDCGYDDWLKIGAALHSAGDHMLPLWVEWSSGSKDFDADECKSKWNTFNRGSGGVGLGTLFFTAKAKGWIPPKRNSVRNVEPAEITRDEDSETATIVDHLPANAVELTLDEMLANNQVVKLLADRGDIFDHHGSLAVIVEEHFDGEESRMTIRDLSLATLRELISETCRFFKWSSDPETGEPIPDWQRTPKWCYDAVLARGHWDRIRPIRGLVTSPVLRADGSILQSEGYDAASGLYVDLTEAFPDITSDPTSEAVQQAVAALFDLVSDFPFKDQTSRSGWLASLLTPLAREAYRGCTGPLFLKDSNIRGSGKSLLADINSLIVTGREATRLTAPQNDEEARKRITALVNDSDRIVLIDNITGRFGCASLDAALTGTVWKDRRLGHTELIEAPLRMTWYASGNNVILAADTARRVCHIRLESRLENPEDRSGFKYLDIRKHVRKNRPALLAASLTILRGYIAAGRPDQHLKPWGSFEGWSDLVRNSIVWCGLVDPGETRTELRLTSDSEAGSLRQMLVAVAHVDQDQHGLRTSDMLKIANARDQSYAADDVEMMREAIEMFCGRSILKASAQHLGNQLSHFRNRVVDQMAFDCTVKRGSNYWFVQSSGGPGGPGGPDTANLYAGEIVEDSQRLNEICVALSGENRSTTSTTSTTPVVNPDIDWLEGSHL